ncbi:hypothetical protein [Actinacidiphila oryziradicis]|uniref:Uncharacterized protein n=1 Tax=Actinacidiphila oryziradicis TaxID=2571141 RepID=A0A4U0RI14_9ACTN|nr:hypothetical protein [Actinacidiphila oryziradicis]TJZ94360.1 hypothetical protein FCI23_53920 [Actinacidiphila oryziradicis]
MRIIKTHDAGSPFRPPRWGVRAVLVIIVAGAVVSVTPPQGSMDLAVVLASAILTGTTEGLVMLSWQRRGV